MRIGVLVSFLGMVIWSSVASSSASPNLNGYTLAFDEEFNDPLSVSSYGPGTKWIAHTPYGGDFGDAWFSNPTDPKSPFSLQNGFWPLRLGSIRPAIITGDPGFWLLGLGSVETPKASEAEIDILEEYGENPLLAHQTVHVWNANGSQFSGIGNSSTCQGMTTGFHTYGALVNTDFIHFYFDGVELWKTATPPEATQPLYVMVDLALGGGWPIDQTPDLSLLCVDYIHVYAPPR
jgi:Glycosyl hydrolases family 16